MILYRVGALCWLVPLAVGIGSLALFAVTHGEFWTVVGVYTLMYGAGAFGIGFLCLIVFRCLLVRCAPDVRETWGRRSSLLLGLLILNVPVALVCAVVGIAMAKAYLHYD